MIIGEKLEASEIINFHKDLHGCKITAPLEQAGKERLQRTQYWNRRYPKYSTNLYLLAISRGVENGAMFHQFINRVTNQILQIIYTDFSKAFDRVNHAILLAKLRS